MKTLMIIVLILIIVGLWFFATETKEIIGWAITQLPPP